MLITAVCVCLSLFRECGNPINVLTGLDYWLDNLMCNVPEVAMCYHLDGVVQVRFLKKTCCLIWRAVQVFDSGASTGLQKDTQHLTVLFAIDRMPSAVLYGGTCI